MKKTCKFNKKYINKWAPNLKHIKAEGTTQDSFMTWIEMKELQCLLVYNTLAVAEV